MQYQSFYRRMLRIVVMERVNDDYVLEKWKEKITENFVESGRERKSGRRRIKKNHEGKSRRRIEKRRIKNQKKNQEKEEEEEKEESRRRIGKKNQK